MANKRDKKGRNVGRIGNRYRLVIMNDNTYEEVTSFKLSRMSVYIALSTLFVLLVTITVATVVFTPLRYYIPGYGDLKQRREFIRLKMRTDSLEAAINARDKYLDNIQKVISGDYSTSKLDTTTIKVPKVDNSTY
ncbi:hypothetical protein SAMN05428949_7367 [Chitinophaga sp. YR627]|uniref:hypothetical protein n=1 Tax=Chitinophaga sp. YR627 TaxID=1881041 RepID=UPI0008ED18F8|nr:hypothetical protein [Chitinophaga sp. YR627]SFP10280.1 hypothetical protein SAMN05428949_7367 [Chitinophaga sp. YR627]